MSFRTLPTLIAYLAFLTSQLSAGQLIRDTLDVTGLDIVGYSQSYKQPVVDKSVDGNPIRVAGIEYTNGIGTNSASVIQLYTSPRMVRFLADVGVDDETLPDRGSVVFYVVADGDTIWRSGILRTTDPLVHCDCILSHVRLLELVVGDAGDGSTYDHADWCNPQLVYESDSSSIALGSDSTLLNFNNILSYSQEYDTLRIDDAVGNTPLTVHSIRYTHGLGTHAASSVNVYVNQRCVEFQAMVGLDDNTLPGIGSVEFLVLRDADTVWRSGVMHTGDIPKLCRINLESAFRLTLLVSSAGDGNTFDHADWLNPILIGWKPQGGSFDTIAMGGMPLDNIKQNDAAPYQINMSVGKTPIQIGSRHFNSGFGTHANFLLPVLLQKKCKEFRAWVGPDMSGKTVGYGMGTIEFYIIGDGRTLWSSGLMKTGDEAIHCIVDLSDITYCEIIVNDAGDGVHFDHASLADAFFLFEPGQHATLFVRPIDTMMVLSPKEHKAHVNGCSIYGLRPNSPFFYHIPVSGDEPISVTVSGLPSGLSYDSSRRIISGTLPTRGTYSMRFIATNAYASHTKTFELKVGDTLAYSPIMGWNSWYVTNEFVFRDSILSAMHALLDKELLNYGYDYITLDAGWQRTRNTQGVIGVSDSIGDMKSLVDSLHDNGFKAGIYTSPGLITCVNDPGSYMHEEQDAASYADWGIDLVKTDWCAGAAVLPVPNTQQDVKNLLSKLGTALHSQHRDILYDICIYGEDDVWSWGKDVFAQYWRTASDNHDDWWTMSVINGFPNGTLAKYAGHGGWNDFDFLLFGNGRGPADRRFHTLLSPVEQYTHMTLWSIAKSPLIMSFCVTDLDSFTLNLLTNTEVLDIHQDPGSSAGGLVYHPEFYTEVWANRMSDGSIAVALFNRDNYTSKTISVPWSALGLAPFTPIRVRDCWRQVDMGVFRDSATYSVPSHGSMLLRFYSDTTSGITFKESIDNDMRVFPNPTFDVIHLTYNCEPGDRSQLSVFTMMGTLVYQSPVYNFSSPSSQLDFALDPNMADGQYLLQLRTGARLHSSMITRLRR